MKHSTKELEEIANKIREDIINELVAAGSGIPRGLLEWRMFLRRFILK